LLASAAAKRCCATTFLVALAWHCMRAVSMGSRFVRLPTRPSTGFKTDCFSLYRCCWTVVSACAG
jgi:hypothetical protein